MFNKVLRNKNKELKQRVFELEKTCDELEKTIDMWKDLCNSKDLKAGEMKYRLQLLERDYDNLKEVVTNQMNEINRLNVKNARKARKIETKKIDTNCDQAK